MGLTSDIGRFLADMRSASVPPAVVPIVETGFTDCVAVMLAGWREPVVRVTSSLTGAPLPEHPFASACLRLFCARSRAGLWHRGTCARLRRHRAVRSSECSAGADDPGRGAGERERLRRRRAEDDRSLRRRLRGLGRVDRSRAGPAPPERLAPERGVRRAGGSLRRGRAAGSRCRPGEPCGRHRGLARRWRGRQLRLHDQVVPGRPRGAVRPDRGAARGARHDRIPDAIEHDAGLLVALSPRGEVDRSRPSLLGRRWAIAEIGLNVKLYPVCYAAHRVLDGMLDLRRRHALAARDIASVAVEIGEIRPRYCAAIARRMRSTPGSAPSSRSRRRQSPASVASPS